MESDQKSVRYKVLFDRIRFFQDERSIYHQQLQDKLFEAEYERGETIITP